MVDKLGTYVCKPQKDNKSYDDWFFYETDGNDRTAQEAASFCPIDSPPMTASESRFSMSRFPKALAAAGLAAVLVGCGGGSSDEPMPTPEPDPAEVAAREKAERAEMQIAAIEAARSTAQNAVNAVTDSSTDDVVSTAGAAISALKDTITAAADITPQAKTAWNRVATTLEASLAGRKTSRTAAMNAADAAERKAMMETAKKLFNGIKAPTTENAVAYSGTDSNRTLKETLENLKVGPHRILTPLSQQGFSKGRDWGGGGFPVFP